MKLDELIKTKSYLIKGDAKTVWAAAQKDERERCLKIAKECKDPSFSISGLKRITDMNRNGVWNEACKEIMEKINEI